METLIPDLSRHLNETLSSDQTIVYAATASLERLSSLSYFPFSLLAVASGGDNQGLRIAAATYLKNFTRQYMEEKPSSPDIHIEFRNQIAQALLQVEPAILKILIEAFCMIIAIDFVKENSWPNLIPELRSAIQSSNLIGPGANSECNTINALTVLQTIVKPFQYFLNPKVPKEPVPLQLELIAKELLVPLLTSFHHFVDKALFDQDGLQPEIEQAILITCNCMYFTVRSYMPSVLCPVLPAFCGDLFRILDSLNLTGVSSKTGYLLRLKTAKRSLSIFCSLITRHRKYSDRFMPNIISSAIRLARMSPNTGILDSMSERIISLAFDVISRILETGPGWRLVSPHFSSLLDAAILPALALNRKDMSDWEEDPEEYMRKNLPSELDEISGWTKDMFTSRKSAINLLGVLSMSKGPRVTPTISKRKKGDKSKRKEHQSSVGELLVIPFLSKFPMPSDGNFMPYKIIEDYYGVLMAYGGLQDFLNERDPEYTSMLIWNRVLPLYSLHTCSPYLMATANWVLGALASCLPQAISADIYGSLTKALTMPNIGDLNCYAVRASAAGAIAELLQNDIIPPDWFSLLQIIIYRIDNVDENESSLLFQLLSNVVESGQENIAIHIPLIASKVSSVVSKNIPPTPEPWPQVVERGFATLAAIIKIWDDFMRDNNGLQKNSDYISSCASISIIFSNLLQQAWLMPPESMETTDSRTLPAPSCLDDASCLLGFIIRSIKSRDEVVVLKLRELLAIWASIIADWNAWEEMEDLAIFNSIHEVINLQKKYDYTNFFMERLPSQNSIIEGISTFVRSGINAYPSATRRACSCVHKLLHSKFSIDTPAVKQSLAVSFTAAAFSRFREIQKEHNKSNGLWKSLLLAISSCYLSCAEFIEQILEEEDKGFMIWACALADVSTRSSEPGLSSKSEIKLAAIALAKLVERLLRSPSDKEFLHKCFVSLAESIIHLKEIQEDNEDSDEEVEEEDDDEESDYDEDSEHDEPEETEEEFLDRYAKAAAELEDEIVEGDSEDEAQTIDLGEYDELDIETDILNLINKHHDFLLEGQVFPPHLVTALISNFPQYSSFCVDS